MKAKTGQQIEKAKLSGNVKSIVIIFNSIPQSRLKKKKKINTNHTHDAHTKCLNKPQKIKVKNPKATEICNKNQIKSAKMKQTASVTFTCSTYTSN